MLHVKATFSDEETGLLAHVAVDSLVGGKAMGGLRMTPGVTMDELAVLARKMTLKLALGGVAIGGAKGGIVGDLRPGEDRDSRLRDFGASAAPFLKGGIYLGSDQGISHRDRTVIFDAAGYEVMNPAGGRLPYSWAELWDHCQQITGFGVVEATCAADRGGIGQTVTIQGFGTVGRGTAIHVVARGYRVVAVADHRCTVTHPNGLPVEALLAATDRTGQIDRTALPPDVRVIDKPEGWLDVPADILVLAAGGDALRADNVHRVGARLVVEGANCPCTDVAVKALTELGKTVIPGIVANAGAAIATGLVLTGEVPAAERAESMARNLHDEVRRRILAAYNTVSERAAADGSSLSCAAERQAAERAVSLHATANAATPSRNRSDTPGRKEEQL